MNKEKTINGVKFSVAPFQAIEALRLKSFLVQKFGPPLGMIFGAVAKNGLPKNFMEIDVEGVDLGNGIERLMAHLGEHEFIELLRRMFRNVTATVIKDGKQLQLFFTDEVFETSMDIVFKGKLFSIYPVLLLVLEANYPDFFAQMARGIGSKMPKTATSGPPDETSANESGK
jgi:hypothetical protein